MTATFYGKLPKPTSKGFLRAVARKHGIRLFETHVKSKDRWKNDHSDCSQDEIYLGWYKSEDRRRVSFFHELGHLLIGREYGSYALYPEQRKYEWEKAAWMRGFAEAEWLGVRFRKTTLRWAAAQLATYVDWYEREENHGIAPNPPIDQHDPLVFDRFGRADFWSTP